MESKSRILYIKPLGRDAVCLSDLALSAALSPPGGVKEPFDKCLALWFAMLPADYTVFQVH